MRKNIKKTLIMALCVAMLLNVASMSAFAAPSYTFKTGTNDGLVPANEVLFEENFNDTSTDLAGLNAVLGGSSSTKLTVVQRPSNSSSVKGYLWLNNTGDGQYYKLKSQTAIKGKFTTEFKYNKTTNNTVGSSSTNSLIFGAGYGEGVDPNFAIQLYLDENDKPYYIDKNKEKQYFFTDTPVWTKGGCNFYRDWAWDEGGWLNKRNDREPFAPVGAENEDWYTVKVIADTTTAKYSVYLNGVLCVNNADFIPQSGTTWSTTGINMPYIMKSDKDVGTRYVYDDLKIYRESIGVTTYYANDFNSYSDSKSWSGANKNYSGVAGYGLAAFSGKGGSTLTASSSGTLEVPYSGGAGKGGAIILGPVAEKSMTIEADFAVADFTEDNYVDNWATILVLGKSSLGQGARIAVNKDGGVGVSYYNANDPVGVVKTITLNETHHIALYADFTTSKYDLYIDGELVEKKGALTKSGSITTGSDLMVAFGYHQNAPTTTVKYDNIRIYQDTRDEIASSIATTLDTLFPGSEYVMKSVVLPAQVENYPGYSVEWSAEEDSNITIESDKKTATVTQTTNVQYINLTATIKDVNSEYSLARTFKVKVPAGPNVLLSNDEGSTTLTAKARQIPQGSVVVIALYKGDALFDVSIGTDSATLNYGQISVGEYVARAIVVNSMSTLIPMCKPSNTLLINITEN